jgi:hypothetical protein
MSTNVLTSTEIAIEKSAASTGPVEPDRDEAERFLIALDPCATYFSFQTFDDDASRKDDLAYILHGSLA